jgi:hypothetical protein
MEYKKQFYIGLKRKFLFSYFHENFLKIYFRLSRKKLTKSYENNDIFAKMKMYQKTDAGNGKYCEISEDVKSGWCFKTNQTIVMDMPLLRMGWGFKTNRTTVLSTMHFKLSNPDGASNQIGQQ